MFSQRYLDQVERDIRNSRRAYRASQMMVVCMAMLLFGCAAFRQVVKECAVDRAADRLITAAVSSSNPQDELRAAAKSVGFEMVTCALWSIVRSLTANVQVSSSIESYQPAEWQARKPYDQRKVDAAKVWLQSHGQTREPTWKR